MRWWLLVFACAAQAQEIESVLIYPPLEAPFKCSEHYAGQLRSLGDALGTDCLVERFVTEDDRTWLRAYKTNGRTNHDWFGWRQPVMAPISGDVVRVHVHSTTNAPGRMGRGLAGFVEVRSADGVHVMVAHIREPSVAVGDQVMAGDVIARVGNNGWSRSPHIHIGAWRERQPLQIRFDQTRFSFPAPGRQLIEVPAPQ